MTSRRTRRIASGRQGIGEPLPDLLATSLQLCETTLALNAATMTLPDKKNSLATPQESPLASRADILSNEGVPITSRVALENPADAP